MNPTVYLRWAVISALSVCSTPTDRVFFRGIPMASRFYGGALTPEQSFSLKT